MTSSHSRAGPLFFGCADLSLTERLVKDDRRRDRNVQRPGPPFHRDRDEAIARLARQAAEPGAFGAETKDDVPGHVHVIEGFAFHSRSEHPESLLLGVL